MSYVTRFESTVWRHRSQMLASLIKTLTSNKMSALSRSSIVALVLLVLAVGIHASAVELELESLVDADGNGYTLSSVQTDANGQVTSVDGQSTVENKAYKLYMVSPGDGTIGISWLIFGLSLFSLVLLGVFIPLTFFLCCGERCLSCCSCFSCSCCCGGESSQSTKKVLKTDNSKYQW